MSFKRAALGAQKKYSSTAGRRPGQRYQQQRQPAGENNKQKKKKSGHNNFLARRRQVDRHNKARPDGALTAVLGLVRPHACHGAIKRPPRRVVNPQGRPSAATAATGTAAVKRTTKKIPFDRSGSPGHHRCRAATATPGSHRNPAAWSAGAPKRALEATAGPQKYRRRAIGAKSRPKPLGSDRPISVTPRQRLRRPRPLSKAEPARSRPRRRHFFKQNVLNHEHHENAVPGAATGVDAHEMRPGRETKCGGGPPPQRRRKRRADVRVCLSFPVLR